MTTKSSLFYLHGINAESKIKSMYGALSYGIISINSKIILIIKIVLIELFSTE